MKSTPLTLVLAVLSLITLGPGCSKQETAEPATPAAVNRTPEKAADAVQSTDAEKANLAKQAAAEKLAAEKLAADKLAADTLAAEKLAADKVSAEKVAAEKLAAEKLAAEQAAGEKRAQTAAGAAKVQALIDSAKALAGENKWGEVMKIISDLASQQLTPAQQSAVDALKSDATKQAQAALAKKATADAGTAVGGLLQPKK